MDEKKPFWITLPGILTGIAVVICIVGGIIGGLYAAGVISRDTAGDVALIIDVKEGGTTRPNPGTHHYNKYEQVTITAYPDNGWGFKEWAGDYSGDSSVIGITMDSDKKLVAYFVKLSAKLTYVLTTHVDEGGWISPSGGTYDAAAEVTLSAEAYSGWEFDHWSGTDNNYINPTTVTMQSDRTVTAYFNPIPETFIYEWSAEAWDPVGPFSDVRVLKAVCLVLNEELISKMASGQFNKDIMLMPEEELADWAYNPTQAEQLLAEAGYPYGFQAKITGVDDEVLLFIANVIKEQLGIVGIVSSIGLQSAGQDSITLERVSH
jgi:ABC-type transport system substrate-binding protein